MSTSAITSSLVSQITASSSTSNRFVTDLNTLAKDLSSGELSAAQQDYVTLSNDALNGTTSTSATSSDSGITSSVLATVAGSSTASSAFVSNLSQLGSDLEKGDLSLAQQDMLSLDSTALNASSSASSTTTAASTTATNSAETMRLIQAIVQAMSTGDSSAAGTGLSELASLSSSTKGASYLQSLSDSMSSSSSSSSTSTVSQLLYSSGSSSSSSLSSLSLLA